MLPIQTSTVLMDSSSNPISLNFTAAKDDEQPTDIEIEKADVIVLVYDVNVLECIKRLKSFWIPRIIKINEKVKLPK
jgi:hypothetical protein